MKMVHEWGVLYLIAAGVVGAGAALWWLVAAGLGWAVGAPWWAADTAAWIAVAAAFAIAIEVIGNDD